MMGSRFLQLKSLLSLLKRVGASSSWIVVSISKTMSKWDQSDPFGSRKWGIPVT